MVERDTPSNNSMTPGKDLAKPKSGHAVVTRVVYAVQPLKDGEASPTDRPYVDGAEASAAFLAADTSASSADHVALLSSLRNTTDVLLRCDGENLAEEEKIRKAAERKHHDEMRKEKSARRKRAQTVEGSSPTHEGGSPGHEGGLNRHSSSSHNLLLGVPNSNSFVDADSDIDQRRPGQQQKSTAKYRSAQKQEWARRRAWRRRWWR
ncbi:hypothetical protein T492DRAFT_980471 [Pavlovales sp. CCMP2436]|nr:hypothetical protein T492DRAFT_980471 [Pavlovales sp. CCMP2436]